MAAVMSDWIRSRRFTGIGTCGRDRPGSSPVWDLALGRPCVLLALRFLALPLHARLLVVLAPASLGEDAGLLDLLVEAAEGALERLVLTHSDFCQSGIHLLGLSSCVPTELVAQRPGWRRGASSAPEPPECRTGPERGQTIPPRTRLLHTRAPRASGEPPGGGTGAVFAGRYRR